MLARPEAACGVHVAGSVTEEMWRWHPLPFVSQDGIINGKDLGTAMALESVDRSVPCFKVAKIKPQDMQDKRWMERYTTLG